MRGKQLILISSPQPSPAGEGVYFLNLTALGLKPPSRVIQLHHSEPLKVTYFPKIHLICPNISLIEFSLMVLISSSTLKEWCLS